jgi:putative molybdopterin biosynthesis protein
LGFIPYRDEQYDFVLPRSRLERSAVQAFIELLAGEETRVRLAAFGFNLKPSGGAASQVNFASS